MALQRMPAATWERLSNHRTGERTAGDLLLGIRQDNLAPYRLVLDVADLEARVDLIGAHLIGVAISRCVLQGGPLATMSAEDLEQHLTSTPKAIVFDG